MYLEIQISKPIHIYFVDLLFHVSNELSLCFFSNFHLIILQNLQIISYLKANNGSILAANGSILEAKIRHFIDQNPQLIH
jgi:hypothetical protein